LLKSYLTNGISVQANIIGDANPRIADWDGPKGFGNVDVLASFAVSVAGHSSGAADLEWFSIQPDSTRILLHDTSTPNALLTFRARNPGALPHLNRPTISGGAVTISWTGVGLLGGQLPGWALVHFGRPRESAFSRGHRNDEVLSHSSVLVIVRG